MHQYPTFIFVIKPYMFQASSVLVIMGYPLYTGKWYISCRLCDRFLAESGCSNLTLFSNQQSHNLHEAYQLPCVQWITPDDGHRRCPKHVRFYDKNKFWILMHLVGYFYETYHDAWPPEHKVLKCCWYFFYMHSVICILTAQHDQMGSNFKFTSMGTQHIP